MNNAEILTENAKGEKVRRLAEYYGKKYRSRMQSLDKSPLARAKSLNEWDIVALGRQLEAFEDHVLAEAANGSVANLGPLPKIGLDVITASFGISPLALVAGIQPIDEPIGLVWFKDVLAKNTRANMTAGQKVMTALAMPDGFPEGYSSDTYKTASLVDAVNGAQTYNDLPLGGTDEFTTPIDPERVVISAAAVFNAGADSAVFPDMIVNASTGQFSSAVKVNGTLYTIFGTVDFDGGLVDLQFSADPSGQTTVIAEFACLLEEASDLPRNLLQMQAKTVKAQFMALKGTYGFAQSYMMNKRWGMSAEDDMTRDLSTMLNQEIFNIVLAKILASIPASNSNVPWGRQPGSGTSYYEHIMTLPAAFSDANALLIENLGRGQMNVVIAGNKACAVIEQHPDFNRMFDDDTLGPHVFGEFKGKTVIRIPANSQLDTNKIVGLWKGKTPFESVVAHCPYMPLSMTEVQGTGKNPLQKQRAACYWGATESMIVNGAVTITINQNSFDFGSGAT
jgi:hypothetical protein